jgi:hypothetical protein
MINLAINNLRASSIYEKYLLYYIIERRDKSNREWNLQIEILLYKFMVRLPLNIKVYALLGCIIWKVGNLMKYTRNASQLYLKTSFK